MEITREGIIQEMKKEVPEEVKNVATDLLFFLSKLGYDPLKYIKRLNSVEYILYASDEKDFKPPQIEYICDEEKRYVKNIDYAAYEGFFHSVVDKDKDGNVYICKEIFALNESVCNAKVNKTYKETIIHELFHLFTTPPLLEKKDKYIFRRGIEEVIINKKEALLFVQEIGLNEINEAMTEVIAYYIYQKIYDNSFFIETRIENGIIIPKTNSYYLIIPVMRYINFLLTREKEPLYMLKCYMDNDFISYMNLVNEKLGINRKRFTKLFSRLLEYTLKFFEEEDITLVEGFKEEIVENIKEMLRYVSVNFLEEARKYARILFNYPVLSFILEELEVYFAERI